MGGLSLQTARGSRLNCPEMGFVPDGLWSPVPEADGPMGLWMRVADRLPRPFSALAPPPVPL
jgi:hypothetical protein